MKSKPFPLALSTRAIMLLIVAVSVLAQDRPPEHLSGMINDYTPATGVAGPWEMHGRWSLKMHKERHEESLTADFSAVMTMEHPDYWIVLNPSNVDNPGARNPHTHHITMTGEVSYDTTGCPADNPVTTGRFVITGTASITANGNPAPFETKGPSTLQVCVTGGDQVQFSNVTLVLTGPAIGHFGGQAIHGVVGVPSNSDDHDTDKH